MQKIEMQKKASHGDTEARSEEVFRLKRNAIVTEHFEDSMKCFGRESGSRC